MSSHFLSMDDDPTNHDIIPISPLRRHKPLQDDIKKRLATFKNYPKNAVKDKKELADNGFMYIGDGKNDKVQCVFCGTIFDQWEEGDDITSEHRMGSRTCNRVIELDRNNFGGQLDGGMSIMDRILKTQNPSSEGRVPVMKDLSLRLKSFKDWTFSNEEKPSPEALAEAGLFYTGKGDHTQCWFCGNLLEEWEPGDVPKEEHDKIFPDCGLVINEGSSQAVRF
ncbi:baculoviral IAP repeat-containing protein 7-B-like [Crassostrea virginica]|uniref:E3 ubiquitin-protein ligase XIAP-like n=1 Tax=Crassostrea virginica TaxID=6565 RepID=A0A8B8A5Q7_CRAVI|nr:E3 ubiquitin-protein ligase XIAP-like [Crassostrea virginica]XP_022286792.1 E3 ubiquitin-protein ligase XIAP-like [Crassostrea virginica]XP_022295667.1 E3 ubiquitin-protein ligase XIAP-like [Crassostrea virginica]XP_022295668.1 E3 ubiquitin-protein ligase XIAP-like [Crassostrea virginica]XP_022295669.1 E3 ubiquitin-protein ligase XIAP-like [Crassostrea virginica]|mmetsp:Transcript_11168/g.20760  ORF Transcript_11168/g.20760 Transcript_11168/m.20760 type:complete len:223 (-) Transcript_11168:88-756(-)